MEMGGGVFVYVLWGYCGAIEGVLCSFLLDTRQDPGYKSIYILDLELMGI